MAVSSIKKVAPDGGYGWVIAGAFGLYQLLIGPLFQGFSLLYKDRFKDLNFTATQIGMILTTCNALSLLCGIIIAPLQKHFGFRRVSFMSAVFITLGILLTSQGRTFAHFMITYGFITALGISLGFSSYAVALNTYFVKNRSKAAGYAMTIAGLGLIAMPQALSFLLSFYGVTGATILLSGILAHTFVSSVLLQPVEWHMREILDEKKNENIEEESKYDRKTFNEENSIDEDVEKNYQGETHTAEELEPMRNFEPAEKDKNERTEIKVEKKMSLLAKTGRSIVDLFDLTLLKDPIYINILIGLCLPIFAELNFAVLIPFILGDYHLSTQEIATFMSVMSCTDICFRFFAPHIGGCLKQSYRVLYLIALLVLMITRFSLLITNSYYPLLIVAAGIGIGRGLRTIYAQLVVPTYVPVEKLSTAIGMEMTIDGVIIWLGGPLIGSIRDFTGSYVNFIHVINGVTLVAVLLWCAEMLYVKYKKAT